MSLVEVGGPAPEAETQFALYLAGVSCVRQVHGVFTSLSMQETNASVYGKRRCKQRIYQHRFTHPIPGSWLAVVFVYLRVVTPWYGCIKDFGEGV